MERRGKGKKEGVKRKKWGEDKLGEGIFYCFFVLVILSTVPTRSNPTSDICVSMTPEIYQNGRAERVERDHTTPRLQEDCARLTLVHTLLASAPTSATEPGGLEISVDGPQTAGLV